MNLLKSPKFANILAVTAIGVSFWALKQSHDANEQNRAVVVYEKKADSLVAVNAVRREYESALSTLREFLGRSNFKIRTEDAIELGQDRC
jgi:hypothetical protein